MTLGDFVKQLSALLAQEGRKLPLKDEDPWHYLFFELKRNREAPGRPTFLDSLIFDWDGPAPKCQELSEFIHALHWSASVSASNPTYETIQLSDEVIDAWQQPVANLGDEEKLFLERAVTRAREEFPAAA